MHGSKLAKYDIIQFTYLKKIIRLSWKQDKKFSYIIIIIIIILGV